MTVHLRSLTNSQVSKFELKELGEGRFALLGEMTFDTAEKILRTSEAPFERYTRIEVDFHDVTDSDSAGLALLLEWITWANHTVREIRFVSLPERIVAIAKTTEVDNLLNRGERWSGFIEAPEKAG
jgi:phospholipid transport system transporter-binding protein